MRLLPSTILALAVISGLVERRILVSSIHCPRDTAGLFSPDSAVPTALAREVVHDKLGRCKNWDAANGSCVTFNNAAGDLAEYHHQPPVITQASTNPHHLRSNAAMSSHPSFATVTKPLGPNKVTDTSIYIKTFSPMPSRKFALSRFDFLVFRFSVFETPSSSFGRLQVLQLKCCCFIVF
jgi:hypothetical protein